MAAWPDVGVLNGGPRQSVIVVEANRGDDVIRKIRSGFIVMVAVGSFSGVVAAQERADSELAQTLTNPIADLISIPIQMNYDDKFGSNDKGSKLTTNVQPVIPFKLNLDWNVITRTIIPFISQDQVVPGSGSQSGLGDITEQMFFSPNKPTSGGII